MTHPEFPPEPSQPEFPQEARKEFSESLDDLRIDVIRLGALTTEAIAGATQALLDADLNEAEAVIERDDAIDSLYHSIEDRCLLVLARQQPMATDLRTIVTIMRINHELERSADLMVNVAKTTRRLYPHPLDPKVRGIIDQMGDQASNQTRVAIDAFADGDPSQAAALHDMDDAMDELGKSLFRHILSWGADSEATIQEAVQVALVARHYERVADHAVTIAERVQFMVTGTWPSDPRGPPPHRPVGQEKEPRRWTRVAAPSSVSDRAGAADSTPRSAGAEPVDARRRAPAR